MRKFSCINKKLGRLQTKVAGNWATYCKNMLFAGWEVRIVKNCDRGLENAALGLRPRAAFSSPGYGGGIGTKM